MVTIVYGPQGTGKSHHIRQISSPAAVVMEFGSTVKKFNSQIAERIKSQACDPEIAERRAGRPLFIEIQTEGGAKPKKRFRNLFPDVVFIEVPAFKL